MTFDQELAMAGWDAAARQLQAVRPADVERTLAADRARPEDLAALLSPAAGEFLETMAERAQAATRRRFGRTMQLFAPLYLSNHCVNSCRYCSFSVRNEIERRTLSPRELDAELAALRQTGVDQVLLVSGEHMKEVPIPYLKRAIDRAHEHFSTVLIEVYPLSADDYAELHQAGCDGVALYQETYHPLRYKEVHPGGPKSKYAARLRAPDAAAAAGLPSIGLGALLGLADWRVEAIHLGLHAAHLKRNFRSIRLSFSFPRIRTAVGGFTIPQPVGDRDLIHMMCALRLSFPEAELVLSTREAPPLRDWLIGLGVITRLSAGSRTEPGGYAKATSAHGQFEIEDRRNVDEVAKVVADAGCEPIRTEWDRAPMAAAL